MKLPLILATLASSLLLAACATTNSPNSSYSTVNSDSNAVSVEAPNDNSLSGYRTGTPSPLNTGANPWTNVNPQVTGAATGGGRL